MELDTDLASTKGTPQTDMLNLAPSASNHLKFRHSSTHINAKAAGYYLVLLRTELKKRRLRERLARMV